MPSDPVIAVLLSAFLHAIWNLAAKKTPYKGAFIWMITFWGSSCLLPIALYLEWSRIVWKDAVWIFPTLSVFSHALYSFCLTESYRRVPFSIAYPVSRGMAQVFIVISGLLIFKERPGIQALLGVCLILVGIQATAPGRSLDRFRLLLRSPWPLLVAFCICLYTSIDHQSVRLLPPLTVCLISNVGQCILLFRSQTREIFEIPREERPRFFRATFVWGIISTAGYSLFLWAQHIGGMISLLGPLRETSVLMGMALSFFVLGEEFRWHKIGAAFLIVCGIFLV